MASTVIYRDSVSTGHTKFTFSAWIKKCNAGTSGAKSLLGMYNNNDQRGKIRFDYNTDQKLYVWIKNAVGTEFNWYSNREFRDCNGWYHIVVAIDTTQATASNRCKVYVNGEELTGNTSGQDIVQDSTTMIFGHSKHSIGNSYYNGSWESQYFDGIMSHVHCCYGYAYSASDFGSTDSTTGEWKINTSPSVSYGTNGFFILKDGNSTTDQSGNSISLTTNGTLTNTEDCPSNVFATLNPLYNVTTYNGSKLSNGNLTAASSTNYKGNILSTLGASQGKWYWEVKCDSGGQNGIGISNDEISLNSWSPTSGNYVIWHYGGDIRRPSGTTASGTTYTEGDIIGVAWNADDAEVTFYKNGTAINSGTAYSVEGTQGTMFASLSDTNTADNPTASFNFGNGYFGTTAVSSAGTNASGIGIFEYDVPTGYTALSTKGLNE